MGWGLMLLILLLSSCTKRQAVQRRAPSARPSQVAVYEVTGYCACRKCCGWHRNILGRPVYSSGPSKGKPKAVGVTASGTRAGYGTVAAPKSVPFGTLIDIPGYGVGRVEDRGGSIKSKRLDVFFESHDEALHWGRQRLRVAIWRP